MNEYEELIEELEGEGIMVEESDLPDCEGFYRAYGEYRYIGINEEMSVRMKYPTLMHEAGHDKTMLVGTDGQIEHRAIKYATERIVPFMDLLEAWVNGNESVHDLAEHFHVDERFMKKALRIYGLR